MNQDELREVPGRVFQAVSRYVQGGEENIRLLTVALLSGGHVLLEGYVGTGKTLLARSFAQAIGGEFKRIQLVPDMLPGDVTGFNLYQPDGSSRFMPGPIFANIVLADELNRTTPRTQAAFLEAMQEACVTVEGTTYPLPKPFLAVATQLPVGGEGTYPIPEGEMDRFLLRLWSGYPEKENEARILESADILENPTVEPVTTPQAVLSLQGLVRTVEVSDLTIQYVLDLVEHLRRDEDVASGPSPRASLALYRASRALAFLEERDFVLPDDVRRLVIPALEHRVRLTAEAEIDGVTPRQIVERTLEAVPVPKGMP